jgi:TonB family protein
MIKSLVGVAGLSGVFVIGALGAKPLTPTLAADSAPTLTKWVPPSYPPELAREKPTGSVKIRFVVNTKGELTSVRVLTSSDSRLEEPALTAVRSWKFTPGQQYGEPVTMSEDVTVKFSPAALKPVKSGLLPSVELWPELSERTEVVEKTTPPGEYPAILTERKIQGAVAFACTVGPDGRAEAPRITGTSHVEFVLPALEALNHWEFTPAMQGDLPVRTEVEAKVTFVTMSDSREEVLALNGVTAPDGTPPPLAPEIYIMADPVVPFELLMAGKGGSAVAEFTVYANGTVTGVKLREASQPEYGRALVAALETWGFIPATDQGRSVTVSLAKKTEFKAVLPGKESANDPVERLVAALRAKAIGSAKGLDEKLTPIYRMPPAYPAALAAGDRPSGTAEIEFVIDREGRARLPRIVSASREEFGWSAATAVSQWVFQAPHRGGLPVDVLVKIPFDFPAPN